MVPDFRCSSRELSRALAHRLQLNDPSQAARLFSSSPPKPPSFARISRSAIGIQDYWLQSCCPMRDTARFLVQSATKTKQIKPVNGLARMMTITTPQRHGNENTSSESVVTKDENVEPLVAFSRPPPLPPVLGPLVVLSFFEMSSGDEDNK
ncbi:LOW QUALITY PROTEIN: uncharacterized protein [Miscanthus floridulus]|uniref:LOW QUALITY PROTEIN: uncharacterized protein n=1 Tax=Miscanthus floridulus TaxID=154761 RepID=UPI00345B03A4